MRKIHIMSGIPASGKSTYIRERGSADIICSRDAFRDMVRAAKNTNEYFPVAADLEWKLWLGNVNSKLIWNPDRDLWIDQTTNGMGALKKLLADLFVTESDEVIVHILETPYATCLERNASRLGMTRVPDKTMQSMYEGFVARGITRAQVGLKTRDNNISIRRVTADGRVIDE